MRHLDVTRAPTSDERGRVVAFIESVARQTGARPLSDHLWLDLRGGQPSGFLGISAVEDDRIIGYAQISDTNGARSLEIALDPRLDDTDRDVISTDLAETAVAASRSDVHGQITWWMDDPSETVSRSADRIGFRPQRELHEMRIRLPLDRHATVETRPFVPGADDAAWLVVNNRAFAAHGEQGGWTLDTLRSRQAEPWFDSAGFLLHERDDRLAAFCWTKMHNDADGPFGEIYVIAVDPDFHGLALGRELTLAGLDSITERGVTTARLFVDGHNDAAVGLYRSLGFEIHRTRHAHVVDLATDD